jgi:hypothetical protein
MSFVKVSGSRFSIQVIEDSYYQINLAGDIDFNVNDLEGLVEFEKESGARKLPVLTICQSSTTTNVELMQALSKNKYNPYSVADAFVIHSISQKILANFYLKINKPERPTRFFNNEHDAMDWLRQFM